MDRAIHPAGDTLQVDALAGANLVTSRGAACYAIDVHADGTLAYTNLKGVVRTETVKAGFRPLQALAIGTGTSVRVTCYFRNASLLA
jgi:hypothetical protein